jgi:hypothetical protein
MKKFALLFLFGFIYIVFQGLVEIVLITFMEYFGVDVLLDFSLSNLFIENVQGVAWAISMKMIMFSIVYIPLFLMIGMFFFKNKFSNPFYGIVNGILCATLLSVLFLLKGYGLGALVLPLLMSIISSIFIILISRKIVPIAD